MSAMHYDGSRRKPTKAGETMKEPKLKFENEKEMFDALDEWKTLLGLNDWMIAIHICGKDDMKLKDCAGESEVQFVNSCGIISILRAEDLPEDMILTQPQEQVLIHELLHFKFISFESESREDAVFEIVQHQLIECLAKALFMAKYGLAPGWFISEKHKARGDTDEKI